MRKGDFKRGVALAEELFRESNRHTDHLTLGRFYAMAGQDAEAGSQYKRAIELGQGAAEPWITYVQYLVQAGKLDEAKSVVESAKKALPPERSILPLAQCYLLVGDLKQAEALTQNALKAKPDDPATLRFAAGFYLALGRTDDVTKFLDALTAPAPGATSNDEAWANRTRAMLLMRTGRRADLDAALALVRKNLTVDKESGPDLELEASLLATQPNGKSRQQAIAILEDRQTKNGLDPNAAFLLARLYLGEMRNEESYQNQMLKLLVGNKSPNPQHLSHYITYLINHNQLDQAQQWLKQLKATAPDGLVALEMEAMLIKARNPSKASPPELRDLLAEGGRKHPELIGPLAALLNRYGFSVEAEAAYKEFVQREPKRPERKLALANFLTGQKGRASEALDLLASCWKTCPPEQVAVAALSLFDAPGATETQRKQVEAWLREASQKRPDLIVLSNKLAAIWIRQGRFDEAEQLYSRLLDSNPDDAEALNNLSWLLALRDPNRRPPKRKN